MAENQVADQKIGIDSLLSSLLAYQLVFMGSGFSPRAALKLSISKALDSDHGKMIEEILEFSKNKKQRRTLAGSENERNLVAFFCDEYLARTMGNDLSAEEIYATMRQLWQKRFPLNRIPSRKRLGMQLRKSGYSAVRRNGRIWYEDVELCEHESISFAEFL